MSEHTPGPWEAHKPDGYFGYLIYAPDESIVAREVHPKANAALIAAAPETAAELERVKSALDRALYELFKNGLSDTDAYKNGARLIDWKVEKEAG